MKERLKDRYFILGVLFVIFGLIIVFQLANLQIIHGKEYDEASQRRVLRERKVVAARGNIVDRNGVPIAVNRQGFTVHIVKTDVNAAEFNNAILRLVNIFEKNGDTYNKSLNKYLTCNPITFNNKSLEEIKKWQKDEDIFGLSEDEFMDSAVEVFDFFRVKFEIDKSYKDEEAYKIMTIRYEILMDKWRFDTGNSICIAKDVRPETVAEIEEKHHLLPGITTDIEPMRRYVDAQDAAHVVGYVRGITAEQYERLQHEGYSRNDIIGQTGIEYAAERYLRGNDGLKKVEVDTGGRLTEELFGKPALPGDDVVLTIDMNLQKVAMESLERNIKAIREKGGKSNFKDANAGAVVALDVNSGETLVMASYPSYDPSIFLEGPDNKDAQKAIANLSDPENESTSEFNRAIQGAYAPGSTFKPLIGIAGLEEGIITPRTEINDPGYVEIGNWPFYCLEYKQGLGAHGRLKLSRALETSCNIFFHILGYQTGIDNIDKWSKHFGFGEYTGIDIPGERKGIRANKETKKELRNDDWRPADTAQASIGQFDNLFTPIQIANYISTIANGGKRYRPFLIKRVVKYDGSIVNETQPEYEQVPVKPETIAAVKQGMVAVTNAEDGTAVRAFENFPFKVAGKTGTAETGKEANHSSNALFVCYAPAENPQIAVAVVIERGVWGANAAPIAVDVLSEYFGLNNRTRFDDSVKPAGAVFTR
jgi:penicillin-binding protein 2